MQILVTGATGYIGGRLVPQLLAQGHHVRAMTRQAGWLRDVPWAADVEVVTAAVQDPGSLSAGVDGIEVAYYLIHSTGGGAHFADRDRTAAQNFATAAGAAGVGRIVYLGGLADENAEHVSEHLASRAEV